MILIKNAYICDGTGSKPYSSDILIKDGKIAEIAPEITAQCTVIDGKGMLLTPGFIDAHRHCDLAALYDKDFGITELMQGITTVIAGNCGLAAAPTKPQNRQEIFDYIEPCLGTAPRDVCFPKISDYAAALSEKNYPVNIGFLGAIGTITACVKGYGNSKITQIQIEEIKNYIADAFESGAFGISCGIMYDPECYLTTDSYVEICKEIHKYGGYLTSHIRGEGNSLCKSINEVIEIGRKAEIPVNISHFKVTGIHNWGKGIDKAIDIIENTRDVDVTVDVYPYTGGSTTILSLVPPTVTIDENTDMDFLLKEITREHSDWDNMVESIGWENIIISSADSDKSLCGMDFKSAAAAKNTSPHLLMYRLILENKGNVGVILMSMSQEDVNKVMSLPYASIISDSLYGKSDNPHPRLYGAFPRVIRKCVLEDKLFPIETAINKMTYMPAKRLGITDRGLVKEGYIADLLLFDPNKLQDKATFKNSKVLSQGIAYAFVNGNPIIENYKMNNKLNGSFIKRKR